jgi:hypothetical protein
VMRHWTRFGRDAYRREDYEGLETGPAEAFMQALRGRLDDAAGRASGPFSVVRADDFAYVDPVDGAGAAGQGVRVMLSPDARITYRLSGTGSSGATLRRPFGDVTRLRRCRGPARARGPLGRHRLISRPAAPSGRRRSRRSSPG